MNKCSGVAGVFNCQGAGWCKDTKKTRIHDASPGTLTGSVCANDVDSITQVAGADWNGETVVYAYRSGNYSLCISVMSGNWILIYMVMYLVKEFTLVFKNVLKNAF